MFTRGKLLALLVVLSTLVGAPGIALAATSGEFSTEVGPNTPTGTATRTAATALQNTWRSRVVAAGGVVESPVRFLAPAFAAGAPITGIVYTAPDGTTLAINRTRYTTALSPVFAGTSTSVGTAQCTGGASEGGQVMQGDAPRPDILTDAVGCAGAGGFYYNVIGGTGEGTTRDAVEFTFGRPVLGFGAWFGDLETRVSGGGVAALMRLYDESGILLSETAIAPTATVCSNALAACGNDTTRWLGFVADPEHPVARMVVIVGDEDAAGTSTAEGFSVIGPTLATFPEIGLAKQVTAVTDNLDGSQTVDYSFVVENSGDVALSAIHLTDDLAAAFGDQLISVGSVTVEAASGLTANGSFDGVRDTTLTSGTLEAGTFAVVTVPVTVIPASGGPIDNVARVLGRSPGGDLVSDDSQDGNVPDADGDGRPGTDSDPTPVTFARTGSVTVAAVFDGVPPAGVTGDFEYEITCVSASGTTVHPATLPVNGDSSGSITVSGIPVGAECATVQVGRPLPPSGYAWADGAYTDEAITLTASGQSATVPITNTLRRLQGDLALTLAITGAPFGGVTGNATYDIDCGEEFRATRTISFAGDTSGSVMLAGIPDGAVCTIAETALPGPPAFHAWSTSSITPATVTIADGTTSLVESSHSLRAVRGSVEVHYAAPGVEDSELTGDVEVHLDCGDAGVRTLSIALIGSLGGSAISPDVPAPASCVASLVSRPAAPAFTAWQAAAPISSVAEVTDGGSTVIELTDPLRNTTGGIAITSTVVDGPPSGIAGVVVVEFDCAATGTFTHNFVFDNDSREAADLREIPAPDTCDARILSRPTAPAGYQWVGEAPSSTGMLIVDRESTATDLVMRLARIVTPSPPDATAGGSSPGAGATPPAPPSSGSGSTPAPGATHRADAFPAPASLDADTTGSSSTTDLQAPTLAFTADRGAGPVRGDSAVSHVSGISVGWQLIILLLVLGAAVALIVAAAARARYRIADGF